MICAYTNDGVIVGTSEGDCGGEPVSLTNDDAKKVREVIQLVLASSASRRLHAEKLSKRPGLHRRWIDCWQNCWRLSWDLTRANKCKEKNNDKVLPIK